MNEASHFWMLHVVMYLKKARSIPTGKMEESMTTGSVNDLSCRQWDGIKARRSKADLIFLVFFGYQEDVKLEFCTSLLLMDRIYDSLLEIRFLAVSDLINRLVLGTHDGRPLFLSQRKHFWYQGPVLKSTVVILIYMDYSTKNLPSLPHTYLHCARQVRRKN